MLKTVLILGVFYAQNGVNNETFLLKTHVKPGYSAHRRSPPVCFSELGIPSFPHPGGYSQGGYSHLSSPGWLFPFLLIGA